RVFPIPARGVKELIISYSHELVSPTANYVLPLHGLPAIGELDVQVSGAKDAAPLAKKGFVPTADYVAAPARSGTGVRSGEFVVARVTPVEKTDADPLVSTLLLVDSSASRGLGYRDQVALV